MAVKPISQLTNAQPTSGTEFIPIVQGGTTLKLTTSSFVGGVDNIASGVNSTIGGGCCNTAIGCRSTIGGGQSNFTGIAGVPFFGESSTIGGGQSNTVQGNNSTVGGGCCNTAVASYTFVGGGCCNCAFGQRTTILGGSQNTTCGVCSSILGGVSNTVRWCDINSFIAGSNITSVSSNMLHAQRLFLSAGALPTADPGVEGVVWNDSGTLKISQ